MSRKVVLILLLGFLWAGSAQAQYQTNGWHLAGMVGYLWADGDRMTDDGIWGDLAIGRTINHSWLWEVEVTGSHADYESHISQGKLDHRGLALNFIKVNREAGWNPYFLVGVGALDRDGDSTNPMINIGAGGMWPLGGGGVGIRADLRYRYDFDDELFPDKSGYGDVIFGLGLTVPFGGSQTTVGRQPMQTR